MTFDQKEIVICAAWLTDSGEVIRGHRHNHCRDTILSMGRKLGKGADKQGFVTSFNRYVTREEGLRLQEEAGIESVAPGGYRGDLLFSEDLY